MKVKWFGKSWGAPICGDDNHVETPIGEPCFRCEELIVETDSGISMAHVDDDVSYKPYHIDCHTRQIIGGLNHLRGLCECCIGGAGLPPDPPDMTKRQAATAAVTFYLQSQPQSRQ